jgi:hypothetical protein
MSLNSREAEIFLAHCLFARDMKANEQPTLLNSPPDFNRLKSWALKEADLMLGVSDLTRSRDELEARLRIALHLCPPSAIDFNPRQERSRKSLISAHLKEAFRVPSETAERLAMIVATVLDAWDAPRSARVGSLRDHLLAKQGGCCAACKMPFTTARIAQEEKRALAGQSDPFKPYFDGDSVTERMAPAVDHLVAISKDGTNLVENLQILCTLCNQGKSDGLGISVIKEREYAAKSVDKIADFHKMQLLYYRLSMDKFSCTACNKKDNEMTVDVVIETGPIILTNLRSICYHCRDKNQTFKCPASAPMEPNWRFE